MDEIKSYFAFAGQRRIGTGDIGTVLAAAKECLDRGEAAPILVFEEESGRQVDFDLSGSLEDLLARALPPQGRQGPGRPRLGVVGAEVTLMPRHWDWLEAQPLRASGTIRRLVDAAMKSPGEAALQRSRIEAVGRFLWSMAGDYENFEEASRALYAAGWRKFYRLIASWPEDIVAQVARMLGEAEDASAAMWEGGRLEFLSPGPRREAGGAESTDTASTGAASGALWRRSAVEIARAVRRGEVSAAEVVEAQLERIAAVNPRVNALTVVFAERARELAAELDARLEAGEAPGPLAGLPFTVKENIDVAGFATSHGVAAMKGMVPSRDAPLVERLRRAGAIPLAHSNLPDLSLRFHTRSQLYGHTINPWDPALSPGGSSGGEGVALATGMSPLGLGNDAGGSVRIPAALGGVCSLKPSYGRFPSDRSVGARDVTLASQLIPVEGFLARSVADLHLVYQVAAGPDPRDPRAVPAPLRGPEDAAPIRIALALAPCGVRPHPEIVSALRRAADLLSAKGYVVEEAEPPRMAELVEAYGRMIMTEFEQSRELLQRLLSEESRRYIEYASALRKPTELRGYLELTALRQGLQRDWALFFEAHPLILGPVLTEPAFPVDYDIAGPAEHEELTRSMCLCSASSFLGLSAVSLPVEVADGRPLGVQLISAPYREDRCLRAALELEGELGIFTPIEPRTHSPTASRRP